MPIVWTVPPSVLAANTAAWGKRLLAAVLELAEFFAGRIESYAKANAPWTDRTTHARQGLTGKAIPSATGVTIVLFGVMSYQIFLELAHEARFAIILPTMQVFYPQVVAALRKLAGA